MKCIGTIKTERKSAYCVDDITHLHYCVYRDARCSVHK